MAWQTARPAGGAIMTHAAIPALTLAGLCAALCVSGTLLSNLGVDYATDGGGALEKLHPATTLLGAALTVQLARGRMAANHRGGMSAAISSTPAGPRAAASGPAWSAAARRAPAAQRAARPSPQHRQAASAAAAFVLLCGFLAGYVTCLNGYQGATILVENFLPAGMAAILLLAGTPADNRRVQACIIWLIRANAVLAVCEAATRSHLITQPDLLLRPDTEFRASALYDHPLTGAAITLLGLLPPAGPREPPVLRLGSVMLCLAALAAFGGRIALALAILWIILGQIRPALPAAPGQARRPGARRRTAYPKPALLLAIGAILAAVFACLGQRLAAHGGWDNSAQVRIDQFAILGQLDSTEAWFGCSRAVYLNLLQTTNLAHGVDALENPWLLIFIFSGAIGFGVFALALAMFLAPLFRLLDPPARRMLALQLALVSTSNSLAHKTTTFTVIIAYLVARACTAPARGAPAICLSPLPHPSQGAHACSPAN